SAQRKRRLTRRRLRSPPTLAAPDPSGWHQAQRALQVLCDAQYRARAEGWLHSRTRSTGRKPRPQAARKEDIGIGLPNIRVATLRKPAGERLNPDTAAKDRPRWYRAPRLPASTWLPTLGGPDTKKLRDSHATGNRDPRANRPSAEKR